MSERPESWKPALIGGAGRVLLTGLLKTVRFDVRDDPAYTALASSGAARAYALWHGRLLPLTWHHRNQDIAALISLSKDGEYIARVVEGWGYRVVRGSTSRGGSRALAEMIRHGRKGRSLAFTPDGPRGPREKMKPGVLVAAMRAGVPIVPLSAACTRAWWFEGWDRFLVPQPFSRVILSHGAPVRIPPDTDEAGIERLSQQLEETLRLMQARLDAEVGGGEGAAAPAPAGADDA